MLPSVARVVRAASYRTGGAAGRDSIIVSIARDLTALAVLHAVDVIALSGRHYAIGAGARLGAIDPGLAILQAVELAVSNLAVPYAVVDAVLLVTIPPLEARGMVALPAIMLATFPAVMMTLIPTIAVIPSVVPARGPPTTPGALVVFIAALEARLFIPAVLGVLASVVASYYYLRIVKVMYFDEPVDALDYGSGFAVNRLVAFAAAILIAVFSLIPQPLSLIAAAAAKGLFP